MTKTVQVKLPPKHTARYKVLLTVFQCGPMTRNEAGQRCHDLDSTKIENAFKHAVENGELMRKGHVYTVSPAAAELFCATVEKPSHIAEIVPARVINVYAAPALSAKFIPSTAGRRPGADDYKEWPSHYGRAA